MTTAPRIELIASLSIATDLALGLPLESGLATCLVATRFAGVLGLARDDASTVYHLALVRHIGCTANNHELAATFGSEMRLHELIETQDFRDTAGMLAALEAYTRSNLSVDATPRPVERMSAALPLLVETTLAACEVGAMLADRFLYGPDVREALLASYERWDGQGIPGRLAGAAIPLPLRTVQVAEAAVGARQRGTDPIAWLRGRAGSLFDPDLVEHFIGQADSLLAALEPASHLSSVIALEPAPRHGFSGHVLDAALRAIGQFVDLKSPYLVGHSEHVASLAGDAATVVGLGAGDVTDIRHAGSIHDLGRVAVSAATWGRPGPLSRDEWERVRLHPYYTERILDGARSLAPIGAIATLLVRASGDKPPLGTSRFRLRYPN